MKFQNILNILILSLLIATFSAGCQNNASEQAETEATSTSAESTDEQAPKRLPQLSDDPEMPHCAAAMRGIESMLALVDKARKNPEATGLKELLQMEYESILKRCPDSNPAYQSLHAYLPALKELIDELSDPAEASSLEILEGYLLQYYELFG